MFSMLIGMSRKGFKTQVQCVFKALMTRAILCKIIFLLIFYFLLSFLITFLNVKKNFLFSSTTPTHTLY